MSQRHLPGLLPCMVLLLGTHLASARFTKDHLNPIVKDTCPVQVMVGKEYDQALVPMQETIAFQLNPNLPLMLMKFQNDDSLYRALMDGTMVKLYRCDVGETNCTVLTEEATKGSDYLAVNKWNRVLVNYIDGEITVSVNMRVNLMGKNMIKMAKHAGGHNIGTVTFLVPNKISFYRATVNIPCHDAAPPLIELKAYSAAPPATKVSAPRTTLPMDLLPFPQCTMYQVEPDHPSPPIPMQQSFALAVYPSHPILHLDMKGHNLSFKLRVNGEQAELLTCNVVGEECSNADNYDAEEFIIAKEEWNKVIVHLDHNEIAVDINDGKSSLKTGIPASFKNVTLHVIVPQGSTKPAGLAHFTASVNVDCEDIMKHIDPQLPMPFPTPGAPNTKNQITTQEGLSGTDSGVETSTEGASLGVTGKVVIIVVVLLVVLLIIALVIVFKKRYSSTDINHTQLEEQQQQQQQQQRP